MEQRGEFPKRFYLTPHCPVWDLAEVNAWLAARQAEAVDPPHPAAPQDAAGARLDVRVVRRNLHRGRHDDRHVLSTTC
jgi:prophage regulatory protein